ncbi:TPA: hypothetical protein ACOEGC_004640 [Enterobacter kobei]
MDESRKAFEQWVNKLPSITISGFAERVGDIYIDDYHTCLWQAWTASRAAIEIELPKPHAHLIWIQAGHAPDDYWDDVAVSYSEKDKCCDGSERYPVHAGWEIEEVLRAAGIKVKE